MMSQFKSRFKSYVVEFRGKTIQDPNIKVKAGAATKKNAIEAALKKHPEYTKDDVIKTHCSSLKVPTGKMLSSFTIAHKY